MAAMVSPLTDPPTFRVFAGGYDREEVVVACHVPGLDTAGWVMAEVKGKRQTLVPHQFAGDMLYWVVPGKTPRGSSRLFRLEKQTPENGSPITSMRYDLTPEALHLARDGKRMLTYVHATVYPPHGVDTVYKRSGFFHPVYTPEGKVLTGIQPPDHYHHYGIMNPWTYTRFEGREIDFWNLYKKEGTVQFGGYLHAIQGPVLAGFRALHQHLTFPGQPQSKVALHETVEVKAFWHPGHFQWDFHSQLFVPGSEVLLNTYRYGGLVFRGTETWHAGNTTLLTSEGVNRSGADGTRARWVMVQDGKEGILLMAHPQNFNAPEPIRVWPVDAQAIFINFSPTKDRDWLLETGKSYQLQYRFCTFSGPLSAAEAEALWRNFAFPPLVQRVL
jgi:hypothetical protein